MNENSIHPFVWPLFLSALMAGSITLFAYRSKSRGSNLFALITLCALVYAVTYGFELLSATREAALFWVKIEYVAIVIIPVLLLWFTLLYTGRDEWLTPPAIILSFVLPAIFLLLLWTNQWHGLFYESAGIAVVNGFPQLSTSPGVAYWGNLLYAYTLLLISILLLILYFREAPPLYRPQISILIMGLLIPWIGDIIYVIFFRSRAGIDLAPVTFALAGGVMAIGIFRYQFLDLMPVARNKLVETMQDAWIVLDAQNRFVDLNSAAQAILQQPHNKLIGTSIHTLLPAGHSLLALLATPAEQQMEINLPVDGAPRRTYDVRLSLLPGRQKQDAGRLLVLHDISKRKQAENALRALNRNLESTIRARTAEISTEKERIDIILRTVNDGIVLINSELIIAFANTGMLRLIEMAEADLLGQPLDALQMWEDVGLWERIKAVLQKGDSWHGEINLRRRDARVFTCALVASPVGITPDHGLGAIATFRDITSQKKLNEVRNQFIDNISHELRTPITNLKLYLDLLGHTPPAEKTERYLSVLRKQTERLENLAQGIIELARLESSHDISQWQPLWLPPLITSVLTRYDALINQRQLRVAVNRPDIPLPEIYGDPEQVEQAISELIINAITFSPVGSEIHVTMAYTVKADQSWAIIAVADDGPGIPLEEQENIFERFYRGSNAAQKTIPGLGLGLSMIKKIMEDHDGQVEVSSQGSQGSTFTLWFPVARRGDSTAG